MLAATLAGIACGCGAIISNGSQSPVPQSSSFTISGMVYGGQQAMANASVQVYGTGTAGDGSASTPLLSSPAKTDATGAFTASVQACPSSAGEAYLVASGGSPVELGGVTNANATLMTLLGSCSTLSSRSSIRINEVTTIATVYAVAPYMSSASSVGFGGGDAQAFAGGLNLASELADLPAGTSPGAVPAGEAAPVEKLDSLANIVSNCVDSAGGSAGDGSACGNLFEYAGGVSSAKDTVGAVLAIAKAPTENVDALYALAGTSNGYQPVLSGAPTDWRMDLIQTPPAPTFSPAAGAYSSAQTVTLADADGEAVFYYTTDGSTPTPSSARYAGSISVSSSTTVRAIAVDEGLISGVGSAAYTIGGPPAPEFSPAPGNYSLAPSVTLTDGDGSAALFYTTDGSAPTASSARYNGPIVLSASTTIHAIAVDGGLSSGVATGAYTLTPPPLLPVINSFTAASGTILEGSTSNLSWSTSGANTVAITPGSFTSASAAGSTTVSPGATTTYTLTATNGAGSVSATVTVTVQAAPSLPVINSFTANPGSITAGSTSNLSWSTSGANTVAITPGSFTSASATGSTTVTPAATTTYTLTATNSTGSTTATVTVTVTAAGGTLRILTTGCPGGTQNTAYAGCTIVATGGTPPYTFSINGSAGYAPLPEGMILDAGTGAISSGLIGGQGAYTPQILVSDSAGGQATQSIRFAINGSNTFLANIFPSNSIFHHRVDAASTGLPVDTSPAAPIYSGYLAETIKPFFGNNSAAPFPNGIPAIEVPASQSEVPVSTTVYQSYYTAGPIPGYAPVEGTSNSTGDRHVLVYVEAGSGTSPALYEMWQGIYEGGPWIDSSNALWPDTSGNNLTPQGQGTTDAAGLPVGPLLVNADEVIGTGTPTAPNGTVQHPIRFTLNHMLNYWVWPATQSAGVGHCTQNGATIPTEAQISQSSPPSSCTMSAPAGEIYRLKASVSTPACAATSPQAAIIITGLRNYGIILADNGRSGGLIGTPDARWSDADLACLTSLTLADFEPVNVSSVMVSNDSGATSH